jgi:hypothetical protein
MRNVTAGQVSGAAVDIGLNYEEGNPGNFPPTVRNVVVQNLVCRNSRQALNLRGYANAPIQNVSLEQCTFKHTDKPKVVENVKGLVLKDVKFNGADSGAGFQPAAGF